MASLIGRKVHRVQEIIIPVLRDRLPGVEVVSWVPKPQLREFPLVEIRRLGGIVGASMPTGKFDRPVIELSAYSKTCLEDTEDLLMDAREILFDMVDRQTVTAAGSLNSFFETLGPTQFDSPYEDSWRVQTLIQLGVRPPR